MGALEGHGAPIRDIAVDEAFNQVVSLDAEGAMRVWDLRTMRCVQRLNSRPTEEAGSGGGEAADSGGGGHMTKPGQVDVGVDVKDERHAVSAFAFDAEQGRIVGGQQGLHSWSSRLDPSKRPRKGNEQAAGDKSPAPKSPTAASDPAAAARAEPAAAASEPAASTLAVATSTSTAPSAAAASSSKLSSSKLSSSKRSSSKGKVAPTSHGGAALTSLLYNDVTTQRLESILGMCLLPCTPRTLPAVLSASLRCPHAPFSRCPLRSLLPFSSTA